MIMGIVADDVTGSNDIGIMFAKGGCLTHVYEFSEDVDFWQAADPQIVILDTNSRLDPPDVAYKKVFAATKLLQAKGCRQFHNKTCSVFRGNIGVEFDAMLDALGLEFAVVVLGFPKNGRITRDGIHYVHGKKLEESEFRTDPIHPMTRSSLVDILKSQTRRKVGMIGHEIVSQGVQALRTQIQQLKAQYQYVILDVLDQNALRTIASAVHDEPVLCGSSALAEELPYVWGVSPAGHEALDLPHLEQTGILCVAGSLMPQTAAQIDHLRVNNIPDFELNTLEIFDPAARETEIGRLADAISSQLRSGSDAVFHSPNQPSTVEATRAIGRSCGFTKTQISRLVSETLAEVTARVLSLSGQNRLVVAGGETSAAVCSRLGVNGMRVWKEIQPGLPSCISLNEPAILLVLKSGSFGKTDFFEKALEHLREQ